MSTSPKRNLPPLKLALSNILVGAIAGALFGVGFGALASFFEGGPELIQGIEESWLWFTVMGVFIGMGGLYPYRENA